MSGPPRKPTNQLRLAGSDKARQRKHEPITDLQIPIAPNELSEAAKAYWERLVQVLGPMRIVSTVDSMALQQFAEYLARWQKATDQIARLGEVIPVRDASGTIISMKRSPWVAMQIEYGLMIRRYAAEFGMTPAARSRVESDRGEAQDFTFSRARAVG